MRLDDYRERLAADPLTPGQLGAIHGEFGRLGYRNPADRPARLAATAALARCAPIGSTKELTQGEAGRVVRALRGYATAAELAADLTPPPRRRVTWADVLAELLAALRNAA